MKPPAWILVLGLPGLACTAPINGVVSQDAAARGIVQREIADSVFTGIRLPPPMVGQLVDNDIFDAAGVVHPGADTTLSFTLPATRAMNAILLGERVHWTFRAPDGTKLIPGTTANTDDYVGSEPGDIPGFLLHRPPIGVWSVEVGGARRDSVADYMLFVSVDEDLPRIAHLEIMARSALPNESNVARPGDVVFVRTFITDHSKPVTGIQWTVRATTPDTSLMTIAVHDDGRHSDGDADDGVYVGAFRVGPTEGYYLIRAIGQAPDGVRFFVHYAVAVRDESLQRAR